MLWKEWHFDKGWYTAKSPTGAKWLPNLGASVSEDEGLRRSKRKRRLEPRYQLSSFKRKQSKCAPKKNPVSSRSTLINLSKAKMLQHIRLKRPQQFTCTDCDRIYPSYVEVEEHFQTHLKAFRCMYCESTFTEKLQLTVHLYNHTGFFCNICGEEFPRNSILITHLRTHTLKKRSQ